MIKNGVNAIMHTMLENAFLNVVVNSPIVLSGACERLFGKGTTAKCVEHQEDEIKVEATASGQTMTIIFATVRAKEDSEKLMRVESLEVL